MRSTRFALLVLLPVAACSDHDSSSAQLLNTVAFETRAETPTGVGDLADAVLADLNGDGLAEMVAVSSSGAAVVMVAQGAGDFSAGRQYQVVDNPVGIGSGDLDGDGDADLVVVAGQRASVLLNVGGEFPAIGEFPIGTNVSDLALGDLNGDGIVDLIVSDIGGGGITAFAGNGDGSFQAGVAVPSTGGPRIGGLALGDVNQDGRADLAVCDVDNDRLSVLLGVSGGFPSQEVVVTVGRTPVAAAIGDVTADGHPDIVVSNMVGGSIDVVSHTGSNRFDVVMSRNVDGMPTDAVIADVTGDGVPDAVHCIVDHSAVNIFRGEAGGLSAQALQMSATGSPLRPAVTDTNRDGIPDLIVFSLGIDRANLYIGRAGEPVGGRLHKTPVPSPDVVAASDFDGDGRIDIATAGLATSMVSFLRSTTDGAGREVLSEIMTVDLGRKVQNVVAADVDRDGRPDLLVSVLGGIHILANTSAGGSLSFQVLPGSGGLLAGGAGPFEMLGEDIDGDGVVDLAVAYHEENKILFLRGSGSGFEFDPARGLLLPGRPFGLAAGDFDADGRKEVAVSRADAAMVSILELNGGDLEHSADIPVGSIPNYLRRADFNRDGRIDLVVSNAASDAITILIAEVGGFRKLDVAVGKRPTALLATDLNRDGNPDILVASLSGSDFTVVLGDGTGGITRAQAFPGTYTASSAALGDLTGDGLPDLMIASLFSPRLAVFRNVSSVE